MIEPIEAAMSGRGIGATAAKHEEGETGLRLVVLPLRSLPSLFPGTGRKGFPDEIHRLASR